MSGAHRLTRTEDAMNPAQRMFEAAQAWLAELSSDQLDRAVAPWPSEEERHRWFYTPTDHGGLPLADMRPAQQGRAMQLVATGLSKPGYVTATTIMGLENVLDQVENWQVDWGRERGRDPQMYWLKIFGEPDLRGPWSWRFGGHHVSVQHSVRDGEVIASSPSFLGADPPNRRCSADICCAPWEPPKTWPANWSDRSTKVRPPRR
ncbi:DUF3500 domain-containing protein [Mycobacterium aquaticum]|uniref:DUF3500 domain-containing protein n=1 Tax=Mycobacterium aquaticum TaxID=1927124 RepID=UPI001B80CF7C|nr:DUF3500 domain-containing protein [Mycobacterium aquaticum]